MKQIQELQASHYNVTVSFLSSLRLCSQVEKRKVNVVNRCLKQQNILKMASEQNDEPLALPSTAHEAQTRHMLSVDEPVKLDSLGPMVVNADGSISRIVNWTSMTEEEKQRTIRVITRRNQKRLLELRDELAESGWLG